MKFNIQKNYFFHCAQEAGSNRQTELKQTLELCFGDPLAALVGSFWVQILSFMPLTGLRLHRGVLYVEERLTWGWEWSFEATTGYTLFSRMFQLSLNDSSVINFRKVSLLRHSLALALIAFCLRAQFEFEWLIIIRATLHGRFRTTFNTQTKQNYLTLDFLIFCK